MRVRLPPRAPVLSWSYASTGRRRQKSKGGFRTRKAAEAALRELVASVDAGRYVERSTRTVADYSTGGSRWSGPGCGRRA
ncbi:MAG: Arm DNA-binding domain-containing protein [Nitriliruptorales bacterium]